MIAVLLVVMGVTLLGVDAVDFSFNGLSLLALILMTTGLWVGGAFDRTTWVGTPEQDAYCARVDAELDTEGTR